MKFYAKYSLKEHACSLVNIFTLNKMFSFYSQIECIITLYQSEVIFIRKKWMLMFAIYS